MKRVGFLGIAACFAIALVTATGHGQILLNELDVNPGGADDGCEYVELIGPPGATVENIHFVSLEGDANANEGQATAVITFGSPGPVLGSNGLLVVVSAAGCGSRTYPAGTTVITTTFLNSGVLQNTSNSFLLISSVTPITPNTDYDTNDDGTLEGLPVGATILDSVSWLDLGTTDIVYGAVVTAPGTTSTVVIGAATRFVGNNRANYPGAWYAAARTGSPGDTTYSGTVRTLNFPANGALTPGAPNIGNAPPDAPIDLNGDGQTDYVVVRPAGGAGSQLTWFTQFNDGSPFPFRDWGVSGDQMIAGDYDGDGADDITLFRPSTGAFYILHTATLTMRIESFGQAGDDARVVGDYDGDGRDDVAVYRPGAQSRWYYKTGPNAQFVTVEWGQTGDFLVPGDYDGDGKADFAIKRDSGNLSNFYIRHATGELRVSEFGKGQVCPGDYDGDGKTDLCLIDASATYTWVVKPSNTPGSQNILDTWGVTGDIPVLGDFTGDGKADYAVWRPGSPGVFYVMTVGERAIFSKVWGQTGDLPVARNAGF